MTWPTLDTIYAPATADRNGARPIRLLGDDLSALTAAERAWLAEHRFGPGRVIALPAVDGRIAGLAIGTSGKSNADAVTLGAAASGAAPGTYRIDGALPSAELASIAWGLGAYRFQRYKTTGAPQAAAHLHLPANVLETRVRAIVEGVHFGRDLINTPSSDMGPAELEAAARTLAARHGAVVTAIVGDDLLVQNFPMLHAVGRASTRAPRLIDLTWGSEGPRITLVGKGICFDTGGLDIKPASSMLLMKKDMGGAAAVLALGHMIMATRQRVRLRILIAAAENAIAGNAFRPGDILTSRAGLTVEIGNTDAEGRLVLADALALADAEQPDTLITMATLTGAARTAVGPELAPYYTDDDDFAARLETAAGATADPVWRMPFWSGYESMLDSPVADLNNVSESPYAGSIVAALFLRRFVRTTRRYAHFDIFGWRPGPKPLGPKGGEVNAARALFETIRGLAG